MMAYLRCKHCAVEFIPTKRQKKRMKYEGKIPLCSKACSYAVGGQKLRKDVPQRGPCPTCGELFKSRTAKMYCTLDCWTSSDRFKAQARDNMRRGSITQGQKPKHQCVCLECGVEYYVIASRKSKFCSVSHYRKYMAKRFDRWIANPETIALPQAYDEFLTQSKLPCLVEGCDWVGEHLSAHMNFAHGIQAEEFKRAAGFNMRTGVVGIELHERLCERPGAGDRGRAALALVDRDKTPVRKNYYSLEGAEHHHKRRALVLAEPGPRRPCKNCGKEFQQTIVYGYTKYCTIKCRDEFLQRRTAAKCYGLICATCGCEFKGNRAQQLRDERHKEVVCSPRCRAFLNSHRNRTAAS